MLRYSEKYARCSARKKKKIGNLRIFKEVFGAPGKDKIKALPQKRKQVTNQEKSVNEQGCLPWKNPNFSGRDSDCWR